MPATPLTRIGFRRDVRLFLTTLVAFFVALIVVLVVVVQSIVAAAGQATLEAANATAGIAMREVREALSSPGGVPDADALLISLRTRYGFAGVALDGERKAVSGETGPDTIAVRRDLPRGRIVFYFDAAAIRSAQRRAFWISVISLAAALGASILLLSYVPRVLRPFEEMLDDARKLDRQPEIGDEASYLIETFRQTIARLQTQEGELKRLHDVEKTRADELQSITSTLTRNLGSGFIAFAEDGSVVDVNAAGREILHLPPDAVVAGQPIAALLGGSELARVLDSAVRDRMPLVRREVELPAEEGRAAQIIGLTTIPLSSDTGRFLGTLALFTDLTEVRRLESRVRGMQSLADLGVMSGGIAHEFRNSLATIVGYLALAQRQPTTEEMSLRIAKAHEESLTLSKTVDALLSFVRPMAPSMRPFDLLPLARDIAARIAEEHENVRVKVEEGEMMVDGDPDLMRRVIENLVRNAAEAIDATGRGGTIEITAEAGPPPRLVIADDGSGIDEGQVDSLFVPFQTSKASGLGLGLALARKIVLLHGGDLRLTARKGGGAAATVELGAPALARSEVEGASPAGHAGRPPA